MNTKKFTPTEIREQAARKEIKKEITKLEKKRKAFIETIKIASLDTVLSYIEKVNKIDLMVDNLKTMLH